MTDPPASQPPDGSGPATEPGPIPGSSQDADAEDVLASFDPDVQGLDLAVLEGLAEPTDAELAGEYPDGDDNADAWLTALAADRGAAFADGGPLDQLAPCGTLAGFSGDAIDDGLAGLSDDALVGLLRASRRVSAWQSGVELAAVAELDNRRLRDSRRPGWSQVSEHVAAELAVALVLTGRSADSLLGLARDLARLPAVLRALLAGQIDRPRAMVFAAELAALGDCAANAAAAAFLTEGPTLTTGQLRYGLRTLVNCIDPAAVRRRMTKARADSRVEAWQEGSGNTALAGRELSPADAIAADRRITAIARALQDAGAGGSLDQLRAAVFTALLAGRDPDTILPDPDQDPANNQPGAYPAGSGGPEVPDLTGAAGQTSSSSRNAGLSSFAALGGSVHITVPASTWLGLADLPGEAAGLGPIDAWTCRDLATRLAAAGTRTRWCITLTRPDGTAAAHACARAGPGPPTGPAARRAWLGQQKFAWFECGTCSHASQVPGYRPPNLLCDLIRARNRTCAFPGCRRPARDCDLDHTIAYQQGGRTCPCNLAPLCRKHHQAKQAPGWHLAQPEPGVLTWTTPHGRSYTVGPSAYLT